MAWTIEFSEEAERDLDLVFDHLLSSYLKLGSNLASAVAASSDRIREIKSAADRLSQAPFQGTLRNELMPGLRNVTIDRAIYWFIPHEPAQKVSVIAIFFGGQDHVRHMMVRLLGNDPGQ